MARRAFKLLRLLSPLVVQPGFSQGLQETQPPRKHYLKLRSRQRKAMKMTQNALNQSRNVLNVLEKVECAQQAQTLVALAKRNRARLLNRSVPSVQGRMVSYQNHIMSTRLIYLGKCTTGDNKSCDCEEEKCPTGDKKPKCSDDKCKGNDKNKCTIDNVDCNCDEDKCPTGDQKPKCSDKKCKGNDKNKCTAENKDCDCEEDQCPEDEDTPLCDDCGGGDDHKCKGVSWSHAVLPYVLRN
ncbi:MAG: hypothetical protein Q9160_008312 [Pyrenula sp. 1 TL-2023]